MRTPHGAHGQSDAARQHTSEAHPPEIRRRRGRPKGSTGLSRRHPDALLEAEVAKSPIASLYATPDGELHHAVCRQPLEFQGRRGQVELDFYCLRCMEHVALPQFALGRIRFDAPRPVDGAPPEWAASAIAYQ